MRSGPITNPRQCANYWEARPSRSLPVGIPPTASGMNTAQRTSISLILQAALLLAGAMMLLPGCERKTANTTPPTNSAPVQEIAASNPATNSPTDMVRITGGRFVMGDKTEIDAPPHEVVVSSFYMDKYLVTQEQYQKLMGANPSRWKGDRNPVEQIRWSDAVKFCNQRSQLENLQPCYELKTWKCDFAANGYRLPTEAEWEYAA